MSITAYEENNLDKLLAALVAAGFQNRSFLADDAVTAIKAELDADLNNMEVWTALQDAIDLGFMVVNSSGQYRLTSNGVEHGTEILKSLTDLEDMGIYNTDENVLESYASGQTEVTWTYPGGKKIVVDFVKGEPVGYTYLGYLNSGIKVPPADDWLDWSEKMHLDHSLSPSLKVWYSVDSSG